MSFKRKFILVALFALAMGLAAGLFADSASQVQAQEDETLGTRFGDHEGYTLVRPIRSNRVFLIDDQGFVVHEWAVSGPGRDAFLKEDGNLVISVAPQDLDPENFAAHMEVALADGRIEEYTWDGELVWAYEMNDPRYRVHHGIEVLPSGNVMFIAWENKSVEEAIAAGRDPESLGDGLWPDAIFEYSPAADAIVWEWHAWDHLIQDFDPDKDNYGDVAANPQRIDINFAEPGDTPEDWLHSNAVDYNPETGHIVFSVRQFNELWIIDHNTTTEEAAGEAGDLLYRWGNPAAYRRGDDADHYLAYQHDVQWIPSGLPGEGNLILFSNRHLATADDGTQLNYSRVIELTPPAQEDGTYALEDGEPYGPTEPTWVYDGLPDQPFHSRLISGVQRLPSGNTLVAPSPRIFEVTPDNEVVWEYRVPYNNGFPVLASGTQDVFIFRVRRYQPDFPGLADRDLTPTARIEDRASTSPRHPAFLADGDVLTVELSEAVPLRYFAFMRTPQQPEFASVSVEVTAGDINPMIQIMDVSQAVVASSGDRSDDGSAVIEDLPAPPFRPFIIVVSHAADDSPPAGAFEITFEWSAE